MQRRYNSTGHVENFVEGFHLKLNDLEEAARGLGNKYLFNGRISDYPKPEFHVSHLKHDTGRDGLCGVQDASGFMDPKTGSLVWWSLSVGQEEIASAEKRLLQTRYPNRTEEQAEKQGSFLGDFATSPAFLPSSRMGSFRFTFPLEEVLKAYSEQFCCGAEPVMRVYETVLYSQEVMYVVLVHSPANDRRFCHYPLLSHDPNSVVRYKDGRFIWRSQAMCETHRYELVHKREEKQMESKEVKNPQFYVWDHVTVALHVDGQVLDFGVDRLRENLSFCEKGKPVTGPHWGFIDFPLAEELVDTLWPEYPSPLARAEPLN